MMNASDRVGKEFVIGLRSSRRKIVPFRTLLDRTDELLDDIGRDPAT